MALFLPFERFLGDFQAVSEDTDCLGGFRFFMEISGIWPIGIFLQYCGIKRFSRGKD